MNARTLEPVVSSGAYSLDPQGNIFVRVSGGAGPGNVTLSNDCTYEFFGRDDLYFGLAQNATVFSDKEITKISPLNLVYVPRNQQATFKITKQVRVFTGDMAVSTILGGNLLSKVLDLDFSDTYEHTIHYDTSLNQFMLGA